MNVDEQLHDAATRLRAVLEDELIPPRRRRSRHGALAVAVGLIIVVLVVGATTVLRGPSVAPDAASESTTTMGASSDLVEFVSPEHGFRVSFPDDWYRASEILAPDLTSPPQMVEEILSVGTFPLRAGGTACQHVPENALLDLGPDDVLVSLVAGPASQNPPWPDAFGPEVFAPSDSPEADSIHALTCTGRLDLDVRLGYYSLDGRTVDVLVVFGADVDLATLSTTWRVLDSFTWTDQPDPTTTTTTTVTTTTTLTDADPISGPLFGDDTGVVLLFDNGLSDVMAVDPDNRVGALTTLQGHGGGDPPYRIARTGDSIIVGWGTVHGTDIHTGESTKLGDATIFIPAAEPDRVWLVKWAGGCTGCGSATAWQVDTAGNPLTEPAKIASGELPVVGVNDGLAIETPTGIRVWYPDDRASIDIGSGRVRAAHGDLLAYCTAALCTEVSIVNLRTGERQSVYSDEEFAEFAFGGPTARFSPDGSYLALTTRRGVAVFNTVIGATTPVTNALENGDYLFVSWSPDGHQLFAANYSYGETEVDIARYDLATGDVSLAHLPIGGTLDFVVLDSNEATRFLTDRPFEF